MYLRNLINWNTGLGAAPTSCRIPHPWRKSVREGGRTDDVSAECGVHPSLSRALWVGRLHSRPPEGVPTNPNPPAQMCVWRERVYTDQSSTQSSSPASSSSRFPCKSVCARRRRRRRRFVGVGVPSRRPCTCHLLLATSCKTEHSVINRSPDPTPYIHPTPGQPLTFKAKLTADTTAP